MPMTVTKCPSCEEAAGDYHELHLRVLVQQRDIVQQRVALNRCHLEIEKQKIEIQRLKAAHRS